MERNKLDRSIPFPQGYHDLRMNKDGVLALLTGVGTAKSTAAVAGIAGINPERGSLGSAAWAEWVTCR